MGGGGGFHAQPCCCSLRVDQRQPIKQLCRCSARGVDCPEQAELPYSDFRRKKASKDPIKQVIAVAHGNLAHEPPRRCKRFVRFIADVVAMNGHACRHWLRLISRARTHIEGTLGSTRQRGVWCCRVSHGNTGGQDNKE